MVSYLKITFIYDYYRFTLAKYADKPKYTYAADLPQDLYNLWIHLYYTAFVQTGIVRVCR